MSCLITWDASGMSVVPMGAGLFFFFFLLTGLADSIKRALRALLYTFARESET